MSIVFEKTALLIIITCMIFAGPAPRIEAHGNGASPPDSFIIRGGAPALPETGSFINYEIPHVHPLDINSAGTRLAACNTPDGMVEIYSVSGANGNLTHIDSIRVGYAPVSARFRTDTELWVVNHISDSISIIDMSSIPGKLIDTIHTYDGYDGSRAGDEPTDLVFVTGNVALVSGSRSDTIQRYNALTSIYIGEFTLDGEDPRMLAVNAAGTSAYAAIFESGNGSTSIAQTAVAAGGPYGGQNPPFNNGMPGTAWVADGTPVVPNDFVVSGADPAPEVTLIVKKDGGGAWRDDNGADWSDMVSGANAAFSGRVTGWDLMDNDIGMLTSGDGFTSATYITRQMNHVMAIAINPGNGDVWGVGTDATNEIRFEPNITGTFTRVMLTINNSSGANQVLLDLNEEHLDAAQSGGAAYEDGRVTQADRDKSIGDPRGIAFNASTGVAYITGMGSNNVVGVNSGVTNMGARFAPGHTIEVGHGPTGIVHHPSKNRLYVLNKFDASISVVNTTTPGSASEQTLVQTLPFFDPTPDFINDGRVHLYGTHENSGLGQIACASCHIDARMDRLAWDLGNPAGGSPQGVEKFVETSDLLTGSTGTNPPGVHNFIFGDETTTGPTSPGKFHTMKGPMTTQTMQDIIRHEPHHWRGDRDGLEEFAGAFPGLQGADGPLNAFKMQEFEDLLSTIHFPPNSFRPVDNSLPGGPKIVGGGTNPNLPLPGHVSPGNRSGKPDTFSPRGTPLPTGDAWQGFIDYLDGELDATINCATCHALPMGSGPVTTSIPLGSLQIPPGPNGEAHLGLVNNDGTGQMKMKIPQLRNQMDKEGFLTSQFLASPFLSRAGFGTVHNGVLGGGLARFLGSSVFDTFTDQDLADIVAFTLCINGGGFDDLFGLSSGPTGSSPDGGVNQTAHAAIGHQVMTTSTSPPAGDQTTINTLVTLADSGKIGLIATGAVAARGWYHVSGTGGGALFQPDDGGPADTLSTLQAGASLSDPLTFMAVPTVSGIRMGADRDEDGVFNSIENNFNSDNGNPEDHKWVDVLFGGLSDGSLANPFTTVAAGIAAVSPSAGKSSAVHIQTGNYNEPMTIAKRTHLVAVGGTVVIGAP